MAHLRERFCLVPFYEMSDCPGAVHHAIGSPYFDPLGRPQFSDPVVMAVRADIIAKNLPRCSVLAVSCNTRPYQSYGPVMRRIFDAAEPYNFPEVRRGLEGVMEVSDVREIPPGGLIEQAEKIWLACVSPMTGNANEQIVDAVLKNLAKQFLQLPPGSTLRMPIIGTGTARKGEASANEVFRKVVDLTLDNFYPTLLTASARIACRRLLLINPIEDEAYLLSTVLAEKAVFATLLDKMGIFTIDRRLVFGLGHGNTPETSFVDASSFKDALDYFDKALDSLLAGKRKQALKEAAKAAEIEPGLNGMYMYISSFANKKRGLISVITHEALSLASAGRVRDAFCVAHSLTTLGGQKKEQELVNNLRDSYIAYCVAALEAKLLYEKYMEAEEALPLVYQGIAAPEKSLVVDPEVPAYPAPKELLQNIEPLRKVEQKIPARISENTFHIVIRKFMADQMETLGARRALDNLLDLHKREKIKLTPEQEKVCGDMYQIADFIDQNKEIVPYAALQKTVMEKLSALLPTHGTFSLEAARFYLRGTVKSGDKSRTLTHDDMREAWAHLEAGNKEHPRDYGILSYIGFMIMLQGNKFLPQAEEFFLLFGKLLEDELSHGRFGMRVLKSPDDETIAMPFSDPLTQAAYGYYRKYRDHASDFVKLVKALNNAEGTTALNFYRQATHTLNEVGRYDLAKLYEERLGETWVVLLSRNGSLGSIPIPFVGELSLDLVFKLYRKMRYWWKYRNLRTPELRTAIIALLQRVRKQL
jgi:tetratricopeptide (TPR) repeat protein